MSRFSVRHAIGVIAVVVFLAIIFVPNADAATGSGLAATMLDTGDLPAGFTPVASLTGPLTGQRARLLGAAQGYPGWARAWASSVAGASASGASADEVIETVTDAGTHDAAQAGLASGVSHLAAQGTQRHAVAGLPGATAYGANVGASSNQYFELVLPMVRGPYFFVLHVVVPRSSAASADGLMSKLGVAQARKVPAGTPDTVPAAGVDDVAGYAVGVLVGYLALADGLAYLRNPLRRRRRWLGRMEVPVLPGPRAVDVSAAAKGGRRVAVARLAVQLAGLGAAAVGAQFFRVHYWYVFLATGLVTVWAGGRFIRPVGQWPAGRYTAAAGSRRVLAVALVTISSVMVVAGLVAIMAFAQIRTEPPEAVIVSPADGTPLTAQAATNVLEVTGIVLVVAGAVLFRLARRLSAADARRLMRRDPRPPVLYLRSFGDDRLKLWTATFGRPTLIERFTPRRFDSFEEVLVRQLSRYGPVIAVNPTDTRLAPIGAARETIDSGDWHLVVADWMDRSALIVFLSPPGQATPGLGWELGTVSERGYWDKTLVVVPPVRADDLQHRWYAFGNTYARLGPFMPGVIEDPRALILAFRLSRWNVITADRRTEWTYGAALERALGGPRGPRRMV